MSLDRLRQVAEDATPGPWWWERRNGVSTATVWSRGKGLVGSVARMGRRDVRPEVREEHAANAKFIATFDPPTVKALLDVAEAAEAHRRHVDDEWFRLAAQRPQDPKKWERWESERERLIRETSDALARLREVSS